MNNEVILSYDGRILRGACSFCGNMIIRDLFNKRTGIQHKKICQYHPEYVKPSKPVKMRVVNPKWLHRKFPKDNFGIMEELRSI